MSELRVTVVPVGKIEAAEVEGAATRVAKVLNKPAELREAAPIPRDTEDATRGQHRTAPFLADLKAGFPRLRAIKLVGGGTPAETGALIPTMNPDVVLFVTDVDLFKPDTAGVFGDLDLKSRTAVVSVRRLREAFYRRKSDPPKQRTRLVKLMLMAIGRMRGLPDCRDPRCVMSQTTALADVDTKDEKYCGACWKRMTTGTFRI